MFFYNIERNGCIIENYSSLPIVPLWGSSLQQSTLAGMRSSIDSYDLIRSGFANDLTDCAQIYWILDNVGGMTDEDLAKFRERLLMRHIAAVDADAGVKVTPYTQEIPFAARAEYLDRIRAGIYEDFGGLDVHTIAAGATNDHIDAAYQPLDENADDYEYQIIECVQQILALQGITGEDATPVFKRNRISNVKEQVEVVMLEAPYLDNETILNKLPNITSDEVKKILAEKDAEDLDRFKGSKALEDEPPEGNAAAGV
ncbi:MAG: phage portal protein [Oscillospiraceae bacterium]|nr:phage portal protein [Oscillospiraceae bacterium]